MSVAVRRHSAVPRAERKDIRTQIAPIFETKNWVAIGEKYPELVAQDLNKAYRLDPQAAKTAGTITEIRHNSEIGNVTEWPKVLPC